MPRGKKFSVNEKTQIIGWYHDGISPKEMANRLGRSVGAVRKIIASVRSALPTVNVPPPAAPKRSARPRQASGKELECLKRLERLKRHMKKTAEELRREMLGLGRLIQSTLCNMGSSQSAGRKPLLTLPMVKKQFLRHDRRSPFTITIAATFNISLSSFRLY